MNKSEALEYLLVENGWWLWSVETYTEKFRLLNKIWSQLDKNDTDRLVEVILNGPPREMFRDDMEPADWQYLCEKEIWLHLAKLQTFGKALPKAGIERLSELEAKYPQWEIREGDRDEFTSWSESWWGNECDISKNDLMAATVMDRVNLLLEVNRRFHEGRIDSFRVSSMEEKEMAVETLCYMHKNSIWDSEIWHAALVGLADAEGSTWDEIAPLLVDMPIDKYTEEGWAVARWVSKSTLAITPNSNSEENYWTIFNKFLEAVKQEEADNIEDPVNSAINNPLGILTESLLARLGSRELKKGAGIPHGPIANILNLLVTKQGRSFTLARVILASRLYYFYVIAPDWTKEKLIPEFDWQESTEAEFMWRGYLWISRINLELIDDIKESFIAAFNHVESLGNDATRLYHLFAVICMEHVNVFTTEQQRKILLDIGTSGRVDIADFLWRSFPDKPDERDAYWTNRIKPFIKHAWPREANAVDTQTSRQFAMVCIETNQAFPDVVEEFEALLCPFSDLGHFLNRFESTKLPDEFPSDSFELLEMVFDDQYEWPDDTLRKILNRIIERCPMIEDRSKYKNMDTFLIENEQ